MSWGRGAWPLDSPLDPPLSVTNYSVDARGPVWPTGTSLACTKAYRHFFSQKLLQRSSAVIFQCYRNHFRPIDSVLLSSNNYSLVLVLNVHCSCHSIEAVERIVVLVPEDSWQTP